LDPSHGVITAPFLLIPLYLQAHLLGDLLRILPEDKPYSATETVSAQQAARPAESRLPGIYLALAIFTVTSGFRILAIPQNRLRPDH
jgi:hypothetical protein